MTLVALMATLGIHAQGWPANYDGVMLQGFYWDSYRASKWCNLEAQADDLAPYFSLVWIPQSANCGSGRSMGYDDLYWFSNYNSSFGNETQLRSMIKTFKSKGIGTIAAAFTMGKGIGLVGDLLDKHFYFENYKTLRTAKNKQ